MTNFKNFAVGTILTPPSGTTNPGTIVLTAGHGARFPATPFYASCYPTGVLPTAANAEVVLVTARSTDTLTVTRGQKSSTAVTMAAGWIVDNAIYAEDLFSSSRNPMETLSGTPNGVLTTFTTAQAYTDIDLYKNGVVMSPTDDYTYAGNTVTFVSAPATGAKLKAKGMVGSQFMIAGSDSEFKGVIAVGTPNGILTTFSVPAGSYVGGALEVFVNGISQARTLHFTETSPSAGTFTISDAPLTGDVITVSGQLASIVTGNADTVDNFHASATATANTLYPLGSGGKFPTSVVDLTTLPPSFISSTGGITTSSTTTAMTATYNFIAGQKYQMSIMSSNPNSANIWQFSYSVSGGGTQTGINHGRFGGASAVQATFNMTNFFIPTASGSQTITVTVTSVTGGSAAFDDIAVAVVPLLN